MGLITNLFYPDSITNLFSKPQNKWLTSQDKDFMLFISDEISRFKTNTKDCAIQKLDSIAYEFTSAILREEIHDPKAILLQKYWHHKPT